MIDSMKKLSNGLHRAAIGGLLTGGLLFSAAASAKTCELAIEGNDAMQFNTKELEVAADCKEVKLTLKHTGKLPKAGMGHNWVLTTTADWNAASVDGMKAGLPNEYVAKGDKRVIAFTKVVGGGESTSTTFPVSALKKGEAYTFFCSFPGHAALMNGKLIVK